MKYKLCRKWYELSVTSQVPPDGFALNGKLIGSPPSKGRHMGYAIMDEGSVIDCYKSFNPLVVVIPIFVLLAVIVGSILLILMNQEKDIAVGGTVLRQNIDENIIVYNGLMSYADGKVDIMFQNGNYPTTVSISGEGITPTQAVLEPGAIMIELPVNIETDRDVIEGVLRFETTTSTAEYPVLIEIPDNMNTTAGLAGYFEKEGLVYGD